MTTTPGVFVRVLHAPNNQRRVNEIGYIEHRGLIPQQDPVTILFADGAREEFGPETELEERPMTPIVKAVIKDLLRRQPAES
jgi:hypothetical protein